MSGYKKLALIAVGALGLAAPAVVQAAPMTEPPFVTFFSQNGGAAWHRSTGYLMTFVHWDEKGPEWSVKNIAWVEKWSGGGGAVMVPELDPRTHEVVMVDDRVPPWKRTNIPEPGTVGLVGAFMGTLALRRRVKA